MAIFLRDLYYDTKRKYNLNLISGGKGMENIVSWVYISEDISTSTFLNGGELIITTGVTSSEREDWLRAFIKELIKRGTCGLILNTGRYIFEEDITDEIVRLCHRYSFPLFTMPWDTRIFDITHDYYNRIFEDSRDDGNMTAAFQNILMGNSLTDEQTDTIRNSGFNNGIYNVLSIDTDVTDEFMYILQKVCNNTDLVFHAFVYDGSPTVILRCPSTGSIADTCADIAEALATRFPDRRIYMGSGSPVLSLTELPKSYRRAISAREFTADQLGRVIEYDKTHHSSLTDTLYEYLKCNGSVQLISEKMFCHRNTINYRLRIIKEELEYDLSDAEVRFQLMAAYKLREIQKV